MQRPHLHKCNFRYENAWFSEPGFKELVTDAWQMQNTVSVMPKMVSCAADMLVWSREHCNKLKIDIEECRRQIQNSGLNSTGSGQDQIVILRKKMSRLLSRDDAY